METDILLPKAEKLLSEAWGHEVDLSILEQQDDHRHVARLAVRAGWPDAPQTVILKRWRWKGEELFHPEFSPRLFFNDWASLEFLRTILGDDSPGPQIYAGDKEDGFFLMQDFWGSEPLTVALWGSSPTQASEVLVRYSEMLGWLHGVTYGLSEVYHQVRDRLSPDHPQPTNNYRDAMFNATGIFEKMGVEVPSTALDDIEEIAEILTTPGDFTTFTHGDPVFSNILDWQGRWRLIDYEVARFRHAWVEGIYPRMFFPTSGLKYMLRIPDTVWRQAETAYRKVLSQTCDAAGNELDYGIGLTAACAFWSLDLCQTWLDRAIVGDLPPVMVRRIRQCILARAEMLVMTTREFQRMVRLGTVFETLIGKLRAQWTEEECDLPFYPAFLEFV